MLCEGPLQKLGGGLFEHLQERYFVLTENILRWYEDKEHAQSGKNEKGLLNVAGAKVIDRGQYLEQWCFSIEGEHLAKGLKEYFLFSSNKEDKWRWLSAIMTATGRYTFLDEDEDSANAVRLQQSPVWDLLKKDGNTVCADCGRLHPTWSVGDPFGVVVCIDCIGVHRNLWANKCKEVQLDAWEDSAKLFLAEHGNKVVNENLEFCVPAHIPKPSKSSPASVREAFIKAKYAFEFQDRGTPRCPPVQDGPTVQSPHGSPSRSTFGSPPRYIGILFVVVQHTKGFHPDHAECCFTNGYQEVRTRTEGRKEGNGVSWNEPLQIGIDHLKRPFYVTIYTKGKICGTCEVMLLESQGDTAVEYVLPIGGKGVPDTSVLTLSISFTKLV